MRTSHGPGGAAPDEAEQIGSLELALPAKNRHSAKKASPIGEDVGGYLDPQRGIPEASQKGSFSRCGSPLPRRHAVPISAALGCRTQSLASKVSFCWEQWVCSLSRKVMSVLPGGHLLRVDRDAGQPEAMRLPQHLVGRRGGFHRFPADT